MRRLARLVALASIALLFSCAGLRLASGAESLSAADSALKASDPGPRMFWIARSLERASGAGTLYIQGTLHLGKDELYPVDERALAAMSASDVVLAELAPADMARVQGLVLDRMASSSLKNGDTLYANLSPADVAWLEAYMGAGVFKSLSTFAPWVAYSALDQFAASRAGLDPAFGVDAALFAAATERGKSVQGLETAEFQLDVLTGSTLANQTLMLLDSMREYRDYPDALRRLYEAYRDDDRPGLSRQLVQSMARSEAFAPQLADFNDSLIKSRNVDWARKIAALLDAGRTVFVFAGAAHFMGPDSVIVLLEAYGYGVGVAPIH